MDHGAFDALTRTLVAGAGCRRAAVRLLAGGVFSGLTAHICTDERADAKRKRRDQHGDRDQPDHVQAAGKKHKKKGKKKDKKKDKDKEKPEIPPLPPGCQDCSECEMCQDDACVPDPALNGVHCGDPSAGDCRFCWDGQCLSACIDPEAICCQGECLPPCENGCNINSYCSACNKAPEGKAYCPGQNRCVSSSCPAGWQFSPQRCQCAPICPQRVSVSCPGVPARDWPVGGGEWISLPANCCEFSRYRETSVYGEMCILPGEIVDVVKCEWEDTVSDGD